MKKPLQERLTQSTKTARQQALEAAAENTQQRLQNAEQEAQQQREQLHTQLEQLLPGLELKHITFKTLTAADHPTLLQATPFDSFVVALVLDDGTPDQMHLIPGPRLLGTCSLCGSWVPSEQVHTLSQLGALLTEFVADNLHRHNCRPQQPVDPGEELINLLRMVVLGR